MIGSMGQPFEGHGMSFVRNVGIRRLNCMNRLILVQQPLIRFPGFSASQGGLFVGVPGLVLLMTERQERFKNTFSEGESITMPDLPNKLWTDYRTNAKFVPSFTMMSGRFVVELQDSADTWAPQQYLPLIRSLLGNNSKQK